MWEQEHRECSSYCQHENNRACYHRVGEEHGHELIQFFRLIHILQTHDE